MMTPEQVLELLDTNRKILATNKLILEEVQQVRAITRELTEARMLRRQQEAAVAQKRACVAPEPEPDSHQGPPLVGAVLL